MSYIASEKITAYPVGRRQGLNNENGTLMTESRLSSLVNSLLDVNGFVITPTGTNLNTATALEINILGRYFKIKDSNGIVGGAITTSDHNDIYLGISIDTNNIDEIFYEVSGLDNNDFYEGLSVFTGTQSASLNGDNTYTISSGGKNFTCVKIGTYVSDHFEVPYPEYSKIEYIDGGTID